MSELPFEQLRRDGAKAEAEYMKSRGPHGKRKDNTTIIEVKGHPGTKADLKKS